MTLKERALAIVDCLNGCCECDQHGGDDVAEIERHLKEFAEDVKAGRA